MTQIDLSKDLCTPSMISQIESDRARPSYKILFEIAQKLDVTLDKLLVDVELDLEYLSTFKMAQAMIASKEYRAALPLLRSVMEHPEANLPQVDLAYSVGVCYLHTGDLDAAEESFQQVMNLDHRNESFETVPSALMMLGLVAYRRKNLPVALHLWTQALDELRKNSQIDPSLELELLANIAAVHFDSGKIKDAIEIYEELVRLFGDGGHIHEMADVHKKLGESYRRINQHGKAIHHLEQAITLFKTMKFQHSLLEVRRQHAILQGEKGNLKEAVAVLEEVVGQFGREGDVISEGSTLVALGKMALESDDHEVAMSYANRARNLLPADHAEMGDLFRLFATLHFAAGNMEAGVADLRQAIQSFRSHNRLLELEQATQELCFSLTKADSFETAFKELLGTHALILETLNTRGIVL